MLFNTILSFKSKPSITKNIEIRKQLAKISNPVKIKYTLYWEDTLGLGLSEIKGKFTTQYPLCQ